MFLNNGAIKNDVDVIILITQLMFKLLSKSKDVLYQVSSDLGEVKSFYSSFPDADQKGPLPSRSSKKSAWYMVKEYSISFLMIYRLIDFALLVL